MDNTPEISSAEAVQKQKEAAEAIERARLQQIDTLNRESEARIATAISHAIKEAFKSDEELGGERKFVDTAKIPLICNDIRGMKTDIGNINDNLKWAVRIVIGAVILALLTMVMKSSI